MERTGRDGGVVVVVGGRRFEQRPRCLLGPIAAGLVAFALAAACGAPGSEAARRPTSEGSTTLTRSQLPAVSTTTGPPSLTSTSTTAPAIPTSGSAPPAPTPSDGRFDVIAEERTWTDASRSTTPGGGRPSVSGRRLPVRVYRPTGIDERAAGPFPLFVWAHGLDASVDYFDPLLRAWAERGYVVAAPTFPLTSSATAGGTVFDDVANQPADVSFVLDQLLAEYGPDGSGRTGLIDPGRVAVGGHSLGAITALALAASPCCVDGRVGAVVAIDGEPPRLPGGPGAVARPMLLIHGDADETFPSDRSEEVYGAATGPRYLVLLHGAPHTPFRLERWAPIITAAVGDFLDLTLEQRPGAMERLRAATSVPGSSTFRQAGHS